MNIVIRSYLAGSFLLESEPKTWDAIVILDSRISPTDFVDHHARRHVYLRFDDVVTETRDKQAPTPDDLQIALEFSASSDNLMVCCRAGQSRSAATAFLINYHRFGKDAAHNLLDPKRHVPNSLVIDCGARFLNDPHVLTAFDDWRSEHQGIDFFDYVDDIEREIDELERQGACNRIVK